MFRILTLLTLIVCRLKVSMSFMYSWTVFFLFMPDGRQKLPPSCNRLETVVGMSVSVDEPFGINIM